MNYFRVLQIVGTLLAFVSMTMLAPLVMAVGFGEWEAVRAFGIATISGLLVGGAAVLVGRSHRGRDTLYREALAVVGLAWIVCAAVGCLPFILTDTIPRFIPAYFETMSGFTTTGASVMPTIEYRPDGSLTPKSILFWRCLTNWLGGVGIVVLFVAILPAMGSSRMLFHMEVPGVGEKGFVGRIQKTATVLWLIYVTLTVTLFLLLMVCGIGWFDSLNHALATLATGGFSTHTASVGYFESSAVRILITIFMLLAGVNFMLYFMVYQGKWRRLYRNPELRFFVLLITAAIGIVTWDLSARGNAASFGEALELSAFQVASIGTTTGFATADFDTWPALSKMVLIFFMFTGACAGSTSGGIKLYRILVIGKYIVRQLHHHIRPKGVETVRMGEGPLSVEIIRAVNAMVLSFILVFFFGAITLAAMGLELREALSASIAALGNIGPGFGAVGPSGNFSDIPDGGKAVLCFLMLVGRLEVFTALSLLTATLWAD